MAQLVPEVRESIALCLVSVDLERDLAMADRSWNACVCDIINMLRNEFLDSNFEVNWLVQEWYVQEWLLRRGPMLSHPETRLNRLLAKNLVTPNPAPIMRWWYNLQLHLQQFCNKQDYYSRPSYADICGICYRKASVRFATLRRLQGVGNERWALYLGFYDCFPELLEVQPEHLQFDQPIQVHRFANMGFAKARDLGCLQLGYSIKEVLGALRCMQHGTKDRYCSWDRCGCQLWQRAVDILTSNDNRLIILNRNLV